MSLLSDLQQHAKDVTGLDFVHLTVVSTGTAWHAALRTEQPVDIHGTDDYGDVTIEQGQIIAMGSGTTMVEMCATISGFLDKLTPPVKDS